jgi:hypothetical protein
VQHTSESAALYVKRPLARRLAGTAAAGHNGPGRRQVVSGVHSQCIFHIIPALFLIFLHEFCVALKFIA